MPEPFLKWAGGKRWLVQRYADLLPNQFHRYIEPFLGGGALFFHLLPRRAILADNNADLINAYLVVKASPLKIHRLLKRFQQSHSEAFYYNTRTTIPADSIERAARFIYLNRTCFNGLYRVNRRGVFNVPMGSKTLIEYPEGYLESVGSALSHASLRIADFEKVINEAKEGDFMYVDPPYTVMHNTNNFIKYNSNLFSWNDQIRLGSALTKAANRGALIMISNADHDSVRTLYRGFGTHHRIQRSSFLASSSEYRRKTTELLITNYELNRGIKAVQRTRPSRIAEPGRLKS